MAAPLRYASDPDLEELTGSIPEALADRAEHADDPFVIGRDFQLTFGEADRRSAALAGRLLAAGIGKGTRVAVLYPNSAEWAIAWLATARIGALSVLLSTFAPGVELARVLRHTDVHALLMAARFADESLSARVEAGLAGLATSGPNLALVDAPYLRWIHVENEFSVRGQFLTEGLYKQERHITFTPDGWYATGDLGWFAADGHLRRRDGHRIHRHVHQYDDSHELANTQGRLFRFWRLYHRHPDTHKNGDGDPDSDTDFYGNLLLHPDGLGHADFDPGEHRHCHRPGQ